MGSFFQEFPGGSRSNDTLRIKIIARRAAKQNLNPKLQNHMSIGAFQYQWNMIAPSDIQENISHTWEEYHSVQGRAAEIRKDFVESATKLWDAWESGATRGGGSTASGMVKVDSPMVYTGSERREYSFTFLLMEYRDIAADVADPINQFRKYSCAGIDDASNDTIEFPSIFTVESWPQTFISIQAAILSSVQVTYNSPFKAGFPMRAELTLTFRDIRPLYKSSWDDGYSSKLTYE